MSLADEIFPAERHPDFVQTEWSRGWGLQSIGFGEAAGLLTEQRASFQGSIDSVGLAVFFLQRHRVELAIKELLVAHGIKLKAVSPPHSLAALWKACEQALNSDGDGWLYLESEGTELITLLHRHDPSSHTYRYPVDREGQKHERAPYIDLAALQKHVNGFVSVIDGYMAHSRASKGVRAGNATRVRAGNARDVRRGCLVGSPGRCKSLRDEKVE